MNAAGRTLGGPSGRGAKSGSALLWKAHRHDQPAVLAR
jgi:predicted aconitase with swiveling domain